MEAHLTQARPQPRGGWGRPVAADAIGEERVRAGIRSYRLAFPTEIDELVAEALAELDRQPMMLPVAGQGGTVGPENVAALLVADELRRRGRIRWQRVARAALRGSLATVAALVVLTLVQLLALL